MYRVQVYQDAQGLNTVIVRRRLASGKVETQREDAVPDAQVGSVIQKLLEGDGS